MDNEQGLREIALFAGAGGGILGGKLLGWNTVCAVEWEPYPAAVLVARQNEGILPPFPIWDDVQTFDGKPWHGCVDVVSGGFPCQDISTAGKQAGIDGEKSSMWKHMARIIGEVRPSFVFVENSPNLVNLGLDRVLGDLTKMGFNAEWGIIGADDAGCLHERKRCWVLAYSGEIRLSSKKAIEELERKRPSKQGMDFQWRQSEPEKEASEIKPPMARMVNALADRVDRIEAIKAIGNGQVPHAMALAWETLLERICRENKKV